MIFDDYYGVTGRTLHFDCLNKLYLLIIICNTNPYLNPTYFVWFPFPLCLAHQVSPLINLYIIPFSSLLFFFDDYFHFFHYVSCEFLFTKEDNSWMVSVKAKGQLYWAIVADILVRYYYHTNLSFFNCHCHTTHTRYRQAV